MDEQAIRDEANKTVEITKRIAESLKLNTSEIRPSNGFRINDSTVRSLETGLLSQMVNKRRIELGQIEPPKIPYAYGRDPVFRAESHLKQSIGYSYDNGDYNDLSEERKNQIEAAIGSFKAAINAAMDKDSALGPVQRSVSRV